MDDATLRPIRRRVCERLSGHVLEIGFGSGLNVPFYPSAVTGVVAVEPSDVAWRLAADRVAASGVPVQREGRDAQTLTFSDRSFDSVLSTWTLCTVPDAVRALREVRRVLRPGGALHLVEHGRAPDVAVRRWQDRVNGVNRLVQGGCNLNRPIDDILDEAGFDTTPLERSYLPKTPRPFGALYLGVAVPR